MNSTFKIVTDPQTGQQVWESKEHKLHVAFKDLENTMTWNEACFACRDLGEDWRLPSVQEFDIIYREFVLNKIGDFDGHFYSHSDGYSGIAREYWTSKFDDERGFPLAVWSYDLDANGMWGIRGEKAKLGYFWSSIELSRRDALYMRMCDGVTHNFYFQEDYKKKKKQMNI